MKMLRVKQFWQEELGGIFYDRMTGVWQRVWLEAVEPLHLKNCLIPPLFDEHAVRFDYELSEPARASWKWPSHIRARRWPVCG